MRAFVLFTLLALGCEGLAFAGAGTSGGETLLVLPGARPASMGQAFTGVAGDADSLLYNPAGTVSISSAAVSLSYMKGLDGGGTGLASASFRLWRFVLTPAYLYYNSGGMTVHRTGEADRNVTAQTDKIVMAGLALDVFDWLAVGGLLKSAKFDLAETASASGTFYDFGALLRYQPYGLSAGAVLQNSGGSIKYEDVGDSAPRQTRMGVAWAGALTEPGGAGYMDYGVSALVAGDYVNQIYDKSYYQAGVEFSLIDSGQDLPFFAVRSGYMFDRDVEAFTCGFGARQGSLTLDYAFGSGGDLENRHQFTLGYSF
ncbi:MAG: hypothetical protein GX410_07920 [Elusimicrobia bacterium]|nr:hypothetical protein [Elusimicrobiota bacterium]